jgi:hypothetical protein
MKSGIDMSDGSSKTEDTKSAGPSPLRLRVGVFLILLWIVPLGPWRPTSRIPSAGSVTPHQDHAEDRVERDPHR